MITMITMKIITMTTMKNLGMVSGVPRVAVKAHSASCAAAFAQVALKGNFKNHEKIC